MLVDLASFDSTKKFAAEVEAHVKRLDILVLNAGVSYMRTNRVATNDGWEETYVFLRRCLVSEKVSDRCLQHASQCRLAINPRVVAPSPHGTDIARAAYYTPHGHHLELYALLCLDI